MSAANGDVAARTHAWLVMLLGLAGEAFALGQVEVAGVIAGDEALRPSVLLRGADGVVLLAVDVFAETPAAAERRERCSRFAQAGVAEYWQIALRPRRVHFYQRSARGAYDVISPDDVGMHYTLLAEEFAFPADWLRELPGILDMLHEWGLVDD